MSVLAPLQPAASATAATSSTYAALRALAGAREPSLGHHLDRVGELTTHLLSKTYPQALRDPEVHLAVMLHDIGKTAWLDEVLRSTVALRGRSDTEAWGLIKQHPVTGNDILAQAGFATAAEIVRAHHERWDGDGYPDGLAGTSIHPAARALAVADTYDALTEDRPYREGRSAAEAEQIIADASGSQLDPFMVRTFLEEKS